MANNSDKQKLFSRIRPGEVRADALNTASKANNNGKAAAAKGRKETAAKAAGGTASKKAKTADVSVKSGRAAQQNRAAGPRTPKRAAAPKKQAGDGLSAPRGRNRSRSAAGISDMNATLRIIPLGGLGEIGKNCTLYECGGDSIMVDCGLSFPDDELFGVDVVIPDFSYVAENKERLRGVVITHGHEDHIGALPYFLKQVNVPVYATKLTVGLIEAKLAEHRMLDSVKLNIIKPGTAFKLGCFSVEPVRVNHSIPDAVAFAITCPAGTVVQTGDFKVDYTPVLGEPIDIRRFSQIGSGGVLALLSDSTNAEKPGTSITERNVGKSLDALFPRAEGKRILIASFASNIQRIQQIIDLAVSHGRKVALSGRSMESYTFKAIELGYLSVPDGLLISLDEAARCRDEDLIIITTGSQGEPMSALSRMVSGTHRQVTITSNDFIIISANPIPGNEKAVTRIINGLLKLGSEVIYESMYEVHASGHACQDDLKLMLSLVSPTYFMPVHGEYKHLIKHAGVARSLGMDNSNIILAEIGQVIEFKGGEARMLGTVQSGRVLVDGLGVGDVGSIVLRDRKHLSQDGLIVVVTTVDMDVRDVISGPDIISRGFVYVKESEELMRGLKEVAKNALEGAMSNRKNGQSEIKMAIREALSRFIFKETKRSPMILPVIMDI